MNQTGYLNPRLPIDLCKLEVDTDSHTYQHAPAQRPEKQNRIHGYQPSVQKNTGLCVKVRI
jgi:hypothetical protein